MFFKKKIQKQQKAIEIDRANIHFVSDQDSDEIEETINQISEIYPKRIDAIAEFMIKSGIEEYYGKLSVEQITKALGKPTIRIDAREIVYTEHSLDAEHLLSLEYSGMLEQFYYFSVDG